MPFLGVLMTLIPLYYRPRCPHALYIKPPLVAAPPLEARGRFLRHPSTRAGLVGAAAIGSATRNGEAVMKRAISTIHSVGEMVVMSLPLQMT